MFACVETNEDGVAIQCVVFDDRIRAEKLAIKAASENGVSRKQAKKELEDTGWIDCKGWQITVLEIKKD